MHLRIASVALLATAVLMGVSACTPGGPTAETSPSASDTPTPTPTSTPSSSPTPPVPEQPALDHEGIGPLHLGDDPALADPSFIEGLPQECEGEQFIGWQAVQHGDGLAKEDMPVFLAGALRPGETISRFQSSAAGLLTSEGIGVGSSRAELLAAYPAAVFLESRNGRDRYLVAGSPGDLYFDVTFDDGTGYWGTNIDLVFDMQLIRNGGVPWGFSFHTINAICM